MTKPRKSRNPAYACGACANAYWQAAEALRCCAPRPVVIPTWVCPECKRMWLDLIEAEECCESQPFADVLPVYFEPPTIEDVAVGGRL